MKRYLAALYISIKKAPFTTAIIQGSWLQVFIESSMPTLQWIGAIIGIIYGGYQVRLAHKKLAAMEDKKSELVVRPNELDT